MNKRPAERGELTQSQQKGDLGVFGDTGDGSNQDDTSISVADQGAMASRRIVRAASKRRRGADGTSERIYLKSQEDARREEEKERSEELKACIKQKLADLEKEDEGDSSPQEDVQMGESVEGSQSSEQLPYPDLGGGGGKRKTRKRKSRKRKTRKRKTRKRKPRKRKTRKRKPRKRNKRVKRRKKTRKRRR